jgi:uncharacterized protein (TIGR01777 family)
VKLLESSHSIQDGARVKIQLPLISSFGIPWELVHTGYQQGIQFCDEQVAGPFSSWKHVHHFSAENGVSTRLTDRITYELPLFARPLAPLLERELHRLFRFRHAVTAADLALHARFANQVRKTFLVSGASGFIGSALCSFLTTAGHSVLRLVRREPRSPDERRWDPEKNFIDKTAFTNVDVVIHLAGENIAAARWSPQQKARLRESRIHSSSLLAQTILELDRKPSLFMAASGAGIYGDTGDSIAHEDSPHGSDFLATLAHDWESSYNILAAEMRVVSLRFSTVLSPRGGALKKMLPVFLAGAGGQLGSGDQHMSWVALQDVLGVVEHLVYTDSVSGAVNVAAPIACTNAEFTTVLGHILRRPTPLPIPAAALRLVFGELAQSLLLASSSVSPDKLRASGYAFLCSTLDDALRFECGR